VKWLLLATVLFLSCSTSKILQKDNSHPEWKLYVDRFDDLYTLSPDDEVIKYDNKGKQLFNYTNTLRGNITHLDVSNPQNVLAYMEGQGVLLLLDNTLAELTTISLYDLGYLDVGMVAAANDGNYWLYDRVNFQLVKIDGQGTELLRSLRLTDYNLSDFDPLYLLERNNKVYLSTSSGQLLIWDNLAQYDKHIDLKGIDQYEVYSTGNISYFFDGYYVTYFPLSFHVIEEEASEGAVSAARTSRAIATMDKSGNIKFTENK